MLRWNAFFIFIFSFLWESSQIYAGPPFAWEIQPVRIVSESESGITIAYQETCGSVFGGLILRSSQDNGLKVGVLTQRSHMRCSQLLGMQTLTIPHIKPKDFGTISSFAPTEEPSLIKVTPIQNAYIASSAKSKKLISTFTSQCGKFIGLFLRPEAEGIRLGAAEAARDEKAPCTRKTETFTVQGLGLPPDSPLLLGPPEDENKFTPYELKRIPVQVGAATPTGKERRYPIFFSRRCHEAPIGLIREERRPNVVALSMLVASYPTSMCAENSLRTVFSRWEEGLLTSPKKRVIPAKISEKELSLRIARPLSYQWLSDVGPLSLEVSSYNFCSRNIGIVTRNLPQGLAVGIVQESTAKPCNSSLDKVSYVYEWDRSADTTKDVKPLQLLGSH